MSIESTSTRYAMRFTDDGSMYLLRANSAEEALRVAEETAVSLGGARFDVVTQTKVTLSTGWETLEEADEADRLFALNADSALNGRAEPDEQEAPKAITPDDDSDRPERPSGAVAAPRRGRGGRR